MTQEVEHPKIIKNYNDFTNNVQQLDNLVMEVSGINPDTNGQYLLLAALNSNARIAQLLINRGSLVTQDVDNTNQENTHSQRIMHEREEEGVRASSGWSCNIL